MRQDDIKSEHSSKRAQSSYGRKAKTCNAPAILISIVMLLFLGANYLLSGNYINSDNPYASVVIAQLCVFLLPCAFYFVLTSLGKKGNLQSYKFSLFPPRMIGFVLSCIPTLIFGGMLIKYLSFTYLGFTDSSAVGISGNTDFMYVLVSAVIVPAICEEILLRGIVYTEYEKKVGALGAVIGSAFLFAFLHFDAINFLSYLYAGIILAVSVHITRSIIAPVILHLLNNFICIYSDAFLQRISKESISSAFIIITLGILLLISLFIFIETLEWICVYKADKLVSHDAIKQEEVERFFPPKGQFLSSIYKVLLAPAFLAAAVIFLVKLVALN